MYEQLDLVTFFPLIWPSIWPCGQNYLELNLEKIIPDMLST